MGRKCGFSFSWKRAVGISGAKNRISRKIGIPLTRQGRQRKVGRAAGCFIATAVYGNDTCHEIQVLRKFRDTVLLKMFIGKVLVHFYYIFGPYAALMVKKSKRLQILFKKMFDSIVILLEKN